MVFETAKKFRKYLIFKNKGLFLGWNGNKKEKKAYLIEKNMPQEGLLKVLAMAKEDRANGKQVLIVNMKKNKKFQKDQLVEEGYSDIKEVYVDSI